MIGLLVSEFVASLFRNRNHSRFAVGYNVAHVHEVIRHKQNIIPSYRVRARVVFASVVTDFKRRTVIVEKDLVHCQHPM